ncbi:MAG: hypothetical protein HYS38_07600 [Acidobacteria bacterium]|nr:hypothetical protein [Acidobacteriota bacterium]
MRYPVVITILLLVTIQGFPLVSAQQEKPRRVFTNEDVGRAPSQPPTPTPEETATESEPAETTAASTPAAEEYAELPADLRAELKLAEELRRTLDRYVNYYPGIAAEETDPDRKSQLDTLVAALMNLIQQNSRYISALEQRLAEQQAQQSTP